MDEVAEYLIAFMLPPLIVFFLQACLGRFRPNKSPQWLAMISMAAGFPLFFLFLRRMPIQEKIPSFYAYMFLLYVFSVYTYFHIFNMSETSRRVRMLFAVARKSSLDPRELEAIYDDRLMIQARLDRLVALGQIRAENGRYFSRGKLFPIVAEVLYGVSCLLGKPWALPTKHAASRQKNI